MALTDKDIVITPNKGASATTPSTINFVGADASNSASITLQVFNNGTTGILGFLGNTTGNPAMAITDTATQKVAIGSTATSGSYTLTVTGTAGASTAMYAPVYYDTLGSGAYYITSAGTSHVQAISALGTETSTHDPYGLIAVTRGTGANYSYYGLTRQSSVGMGIGIDTSNNLWFGGTSGGINATRSSIYFYTDLSGNVYANTSFRAPTFYSSSNSAYYLNLNAATGTILSTAASTDTLGYNPTYGIYIGGTPSGVYLYNGGTSGYPNSPVWVKGGTAYAVLTSGNVGSYAIGTSGGTITGQLDISFNNSTVISTYANVGNAQLRLDNPTGSQSHIVWTYNGSLLGTQRVDSSGNMVLNANSSNFYFNNDLAVGSSIKLVAVNATFLTANNSGNVTFPQNFYGPRFYDSNNNGYYVVPSGTSVLNAANFGGTVQFGPTSGSNYNENMRLVRSSANSYVSIAMAADTSGSGQTSGQFTHLVYPSGTNGGAFAIRANSTDALQISTTPNVTIPTGGLYVSTGNSYVYGTMYDYQNAAYYVKPSSTSNLNIGYFAGYLQASTVLQVNGSGLAVPTSYKNVPGITPGTSGASWIRGSSTIIQAGASNTDGTGWAYGSRFSSVDYGDGLATSVDVLYAGPSWTNDVMTWSGRSGRIGNVGINNTAPTHKLHIYTGNTEDGIIIDANTYPEIVFATQGTTRGYVAWSNANGGYGASNAGMVMQSTGNYTTFITGNGSYQPLILSTNNAYLTGTLYDNSNSAYYLKPSGTSNLSTLYTYEFLKRHNRYNTGEAYPVSYHSDGDLVWSLDPTWDNTELQTYFGNSNVSWVADSTAPGGYAISIVGGVNVGSNTYGSGFPMIPIDSVDDMFYMEVWIRNVSGSNGHYMGSIDYNESFGNLGGNPGSYGYWVMVGNNPGSSWTKYYGYITGFSSSTYGTFKTGAKYWTPQALFNYTGGGTTYISGWKVLRVNRQTSMVINTPNGSSSTGSSNSMGQTLTIKRSNTSLLNLGSYPGAWTSALQIQDNNASNWIWMSPLTGNTPTLATNYGSMYFYMTGQNTGFAGAMYNNSFRSPIFYDWNNTGYYAIPSGTSVFNALTINSGSVNSNGRWQFGPNSSWGQYLLIGGNGIDGSYAQIAATSGNLHLESLSSSYGTYLNYYRNGPIYLMGTIYANGTIYDNNNTGYYVVPRGTSNLNVLYTVTHYNYADIVTNPNGNNSTRYYGGISFWTSAGASTSYMAFKYGPYLNGTHGYQSDGYGTYFSMDTSGRAWVFYNASTNANVASITNNGEAYFNGRLYAGTSTTSPIFYDANDSTYFVDPNSRSRLSSIDYGNSGYYFASGDWGWRHNTPYGWIEFGPANGSYAHIYSNSAPFYFNNNVFHGVFYDYNNSGYYCSPAGTSNFSTLYMQGNFIPASSNGGGGNFYFGNQWGGNVGGNNSVTGIGYNGGSGSQLFTFSSGPGQLSVQVDGSLFAGDNANSWNPIGMNASSNGYLSIANSMQNGGSSYTNGSHYVSGYYYDYANTGYYLKASGQSVLSYLSTRSGAMGIYLGYSDEGSISTYNLVGLGYNGNDTNYAIFKPTGGWTQPLYIQFYTGIRHYSHHAYDSGTSFWNIATGTRMMWIGGGDDNVRIQSSLFMYGAHYDYNNTSYYVQPAGDSYMYSIFSGGGVRFASSQGDRVSGAPWYGIGQSNVGGWIGAGMVQVASYYGLRLRGNATVLDLDGPNYGNSWMYASGTNFAIDNQIRANIYYDINNTGYYMQPRGTSVFSYIQANNYMYSANQIYATIMYDTNDSGYFCDPNGNSRLNYINANALGGPTSSGAQLAGSYGGAYNYYSDFYNTTAERYSYVGDIPGGTANPGNTWWFNTNYRHTNGGGYWGTQVAWGWEDNANRLAQRNVSNGNWSGWVYYLNSGNYTGYNSYGSIYFTIGYDNNNSGYYIDPNSTSQLSYVLADNWFRPQGQTGLYFQSYGYGLVSVNGYGSYGNVSTYGGGVNGWQGYNIQYGNTTFMGNGGTWGIYNAGGGWAIYGQPGNSTVGINGGNNSSYALFVNGTVYATSNVYAYSDARSKENIITIDNALGKVTQLRGVYYNRTDRPEGEESGYTSTLNSRELGVIAQEIMATVPEVVSYSKNTDRYGVNYGNLAGLFIEAIKDLKKEIEDLRSELNMLKGN